MTDKPDFFEREGEKLKNRDETIFIANPQPWGIHFTNDKGDDVGHLKFDENGELTFSGDADQAAEIFFTAVVKANSQYVDETNKLSRMGYEVVKDFMPNVANCALQDYGRLNDFMIKATERFGD